jgi:excisionase family DNA binding protein
MESSPRTEAHAHKEPAIRAEEKLLLSRRDAAQLLSISQRALDYLVATRRLPTRRIGKRVLVPVADLRRYARADHPEPLAG